MKPAMSHRVGFALSTTLFLAAVAIIVACIRAQNAGVFAYTLDDPYIHLRLAELIWQGHFGINANEYSSPSSSIVWPLLLAPFAAQSWGQYVPLVANTLFSIGTLFLFSSLVARRLEGLSPRYRWALTLVLPLVFVLATNMIGLVFTGMEHSAHVLAVAAVVVGLDRLVADNRLGAPLVLGIVLCPLLRYEGLAIALAAIGVVFLQRRYWTAVLLAALVLMAVGGFSVFLLAHDLPPLPNSVLAKSIASSDQGWSVMARLQSLPRNNNAVRLMVLLGLMLLLLAWRFRRQRRLWSAALFALPLLAHLLFGRFGWFYRYEMYILAWCCFTLVYWLDDFRQLFVRQRIAGALLALVCAALLLGIAGKLGGKLRDITWAARDVRDQHFLMADIARRYNAPVAVNDIGAVSYFGDVFVLDLWGLASNTALRHRLARDGSGWLNDEVDANNVGLVMLYERWFAELPSGWSKVGELRLGREKTSAGGDRVAVFAVAPVAVADVRALLTRMQPEYPGQIFLSDIVAAP